MGMPQVWVVTATDCDSTDVLGVRSGLGAAQIRAAAYAVGRGDADLSILRWRKTRPDRLEADLGETLTLACERWSVWDATGTLDAAGQMMVVKSDG